MLVSLSPCYMYGNIFEKSGEFLFVAHQSGIIAALDYIQK
jgi:hypothetical protein